VLTKIDFSLHKLWYRRNGTKSLCFEKLLLVRKLERIRQLLGKLVRLFKPPCGIDDLLNKTDGPSVMFSRQKNIYIERIETDEIPSTKDHYKMRYLIL
jgi:hypothetical protein